MAGEVGFEFHEEVDELFVAGINLESGNQTLQGIIAISHGDGGIRIREESERKERAKKKKRESRRSAKKGKGK